MPRAASVRLFEGIGCLSFRVCQASADTAFFC